MATNLFGFDPFWMFRMPLSGDVNQRITAPWFSPSLTVNYAGDPVIEDRVVTEVASYGRQLGWLTEIAIALAKNETPPEDTLQRLEQELAVGVFKSWRPATTSQELLGFAHAVAEMRRTKVKLRHAYMQPLECGRVVDRLRISTWLLVVLPQCEGEPVSLVDAWLDARVKTCDGASVFAQSPYDLDLKPEQNAVLFVGSGWERKGLRYAVDAVEKAAGRVMLFVAGRGNQRRYQSSRVHFLGEVTDLRPIYCASRCSAIRDPRQ